MFMYESMEGVVAWRRCPWSSGVTWNSSSSSYMRALFELVMTCHHPNACNHGAWVWTLVFFHLFFLGFTFNFFLQLEVLVIIFWRRLLLIITCESHDASKTENNLLTETDWSKNTTRTQYTNLGKSGGLYRRKLNIETKSHEETRTEMSSGVVSPQGGAARRGPAPPGGEEPPDSVSNPFSSHDF
jgi:hypothetical protein